MTNTNESGAGSLAQAIIDANGQALLGGVPNTIAFNIPGSGVHTIALQNSLPAITNPVIINGYTQPGASPNTNPIDQPDNAVLQIRLDGTQQAPLGLVIGAGGAGSTIEGLDITGFSSTLAAGITLGATAGGNHVVGNFIGVDPTGMLASVSLRNYNGVEVDGPNNVIGGTSASDRNVISGNDIYGIFLNGSSATGNALKGNYVGLKSDGHSAFSAGFAQESILAYQADHTLIGGTTSADRNVVAGFDAIALNKATSTTIQGNFIGTDRTGTVGVVSQKGITVTSSSGTQIGGTLPGAGNVLGTSGLANLVGIQVDLSSATTIQGNFIGIDPTQTRNTGPFEFGILVQRSSGNTIGGTLPGAGNVIANDSDSGSGTSVYIPITGGPVNDVLIEGNSFYGNDGPAIVGSNTGAPILTKVTSTSISGHITGTPGATYRVEYFATPNTGGPSNQQARTLIGFQDNLVADSGGNVTLSFSPAGGVPAGQFITATATRNGVSTSGVATGVVAVPATTSADLGVSLAAPGTVAPGGTITYTITATNDGPDPALQPKLTTQVPAGTTFVSFVAPSGWNVAAPSTGGTGSVVASLASLPSGGKATFTLVVKVNANAAGGSKVPMACAVSTSTSDPNPANETASASTTVVAHSLVATRTAVAASPSSSTVGQPVTLRATVTGTFGIPAGTVTFTDGTKPLGVASLDSTGHATLTVSTLTAGGHQVLAFYSGNSIFAASVGATSHVVARPIVATQTLLGSSANPSVAGQPVTLVASVSAPAAVPSGSVIFSEGATVLGVAALDASGHAALSVSSLSAGRHQILATYTGTANYSASQGAVSLAIRAAQGAGPQVVQLQRFGFHRMPTVLVLSVDSPLNAASAQNPNNYRITGPGGRGIGVSSVVYDPAARTITLNPAERLNVHWTYLLHVNGTSPTGVCGADGAMLNASSVGLPGRDYDAVISRSTLVLTPSGPLSSGRPASSTRNS